MDLKDLRKEIDEIDRELVRTFCKRMQIAAQIADYKKEHGLPVSHPGREKEVLEKVTSLAEEELQEYVQNLYGELFRLSKDYQTRRSEEK